MDVETYFTYLERGYRVTQAVSWVRDAADAAELTRLKKIAGLVGSFKDIGENLFSRMVRDWHHYPSEFLRRVARNVRVYRVSVYNSICLGFVGEGVERLPLVWHPDVEGTVYSPRPKQDMLSTVIAGNTRIRVTSAFEGLGVEPDTRQLPHVEIPEVRDLASNILATLSHSPRSALLYGPPGSGKSIAVRQVARRLGGSWVALAPELHGDAGAWALVASLRPRVLILDDIDARALLTGEDSATVLTQIETAREYAQVILLTANTLEALRGAILRCGRVDEDPVYVGAPSRDVVTAIAGSTANQIEEIAVASELLPAYIDELRIRTLGGRNPLIEVKKLETRMKTVGDR